MSDVINSPNRTPILHVVVVGFHHKKGCQVEYSYPPLTPETTPDSGIIPEEWKHLPSLALPDGAHNHTKDTTFFHLTARDGSNDTVYGISCYRQIDSKDLINKTADVTRSSVQKSVCVLSKYPLYKAIQTKLEMITHAYFDAKDFSQVDLLRETYDNLVSTFPTSSVDPSLLLHGLNVKNSVILFKHKILTLFKLFLLERRVLFYGAPVYLCSNMILNLLSLFPEMIERGLTQSSTYSALDELSPNLDPVDVCSDEDNEYLHIHYHRESAKEDKHITQMDTPYKSESIPGHFGSGDIPTKELDGQSLVNDHQTGEKLVSDLAPEDTDQNMLKHDGNCGHELTPNPAIHEHSNSVNYNQSSDYENPAIDAKNTPVVLHECGELTDSEKYIKKEAIQSLVDIDYVRDESAMLQMSRAAAVASSQGVSKIKVPSVEDLKKDESDEIDSPESINAIDREDCFSWENDACTLELNPDTSAQSRLKNFPDTSLGDNLLGNSKFYVTSNEIDDLYRDQSSSTEVTNEGQNTSDRTPTSHPPVTDQHPSLHPSVPSSDPTYVDGKTLRDRLTSAFTGLSKSKPTNAVIRFKQLSEGEDGYNFLNLDSDGFPLAIFTKGYLCHPYVSLQQFDMLQDVNVRGFVIGASNILFRQKKHLVDVIVDISEAKLDIHDPELRRQLTLTTADLRFADHLFKMVIDASTNNLPETEWEGGDEWVRLQFHVYLQSLLSASLHSDTSYMEDYNTSFMSAWSTTRNFRVWQKLDHSAYSNIPPSHPFQGNLSMNDLKVKLSSTMQGSERGRKINSAVSQTSKYVAQTGKVVGSALNSAKMAVTSWFNNVTTE